MLPKISIITPSFNQGSFIEETIRSVLAQGYPDFEHIIVDGASTDGTREILGRYSHLKVVIEPDSGQAHAVNKGMRMASGEIIGWLNSDDTYFPGVFRRAAEIIKPAAGVFIAMGRCAYIDEQGRQTGMEHPSAFVDHRRVVEIWKGYTIPQPAVFFHRTVFEQMGGPDESLYFALDYDLFLRYTKRYTVHVVDEVWATYRLHSASKTTEISQGELLEKSLEVSRRYWGERTSLSYWGYALSYALYGGRLGVMSLKKLNLAERYYRGGARLLFFWNILISFLLFPPTIVRYLILPRLKTATKRP